MAKQLFFTNAAATTHRGNNDAKLNAATSWWLPWTLAETRGSGVVSTTGATVAGPTNGIEATSSSLPVEFLSEALSADFTISGTITLNLWASESANAVNAAINAVIEKIDGATGTLTQIAKTARVTELTTSVAVANFTVAPTSTACKRGDRLRVRIFADDAGTMGAGTFTATVNGASAAASGDSWVQFTENLTFEAAGAPTGSTYYLTDTAEIINPGGAIEKVASQTRGSGVVALRTTMPASGPIAPLQFTNTTGGTAVEWYTPALDAFTLGGKSKFGIWAASGGSANDSSMRAEIAVVDNDGSNPVVWGTACIEASVAAGAAGELPNTSASGGSGVVAWVAGDDVAVAAGKRLRFRIYVDDSASAPVVTLSGSPFLYVNGATASASGDTYVALPVTVTEQPTGPTTWNSSAAVDIADALTTAATRETFTTAAVALADTVTASGTRETFAAAAVAAAATITTDGIKAVAGSAAVALTDTVTTSGARTAVGVSTVAATATVTTAGTREAIAQAAVGLTNTVTTAGIREILGASAVALTGTVTTNGLVAALVVGSAAVAVTASIATAGTRAAVSASAVTANVTVTTAGLRDAVSSATVALTDTVTTAGTRTTFSTSSVPLTVLVTTSSIPGAFGSSTVALTATVTTAGTKEAVSTAAVQLTGTVTTDGISETGAQTYTSAAAVALTATVTATGVRTAVSTSQVTETVLVATSATRDTFSTTATTETVAITTSAVPGVAGQAGVQLAATVSTAGLRTAVTTSTTSLAVAVATAGTRVTSSSSSVPLTATVTTAGSRVVYGDVGTVSEHVAVVTDSKRDALTTSTVALHVTITTSAETLVPLPPGWISTTTTGRILAARQGSIDHPDQGDLAGTTAGRIAKVS